MYIDFSPNTNQFTLKKKQEAFKFCFPKKYLFPICEAVANSKAGKHTTYKTQYMQQISES